MSENANSFEGKLHGFRRTQDGVVISYVVHPSDVSATMAVAPLGTRYMVAFAEIGDDGKPVSPVAQRLESPAHNRSVAGSNPAGATNKDRKPFASLPLSQQCAIRCQDKDFQRFLYENYGLKEAEDTRLWVHQYCQITTRALLDDPACAVARQKWGHIDADYQARLTTQRYASVAR